MDNTVWDEQFSRTEPGKQIALQNRNGGYPSTEKRNLECSPLKILGSFRILYLLVKLNKTDRRYSSEKFSQSTIHKFQGQSTQKESQDSKPSNRNKNLTIIRCLELFPSKKTGQRQKGKRVLKSECIFSNQEIKENKSQGQNRK